MRSRGRRALVAGAFLAAVAACVELGPSGGITAISNLRLPYPSVVLGDLLRDSLGNPAPLSVTVFGSAGETLTDQVVSFIAIDSTIGVDADGTVHGLLRDSLGGRIVASAGGLQTPPHRIIVTTAAAEVVPGATIASIEFDNTKPDTASSTNWSAALTLTVRDATGAGAQGYVVGYSLLRSPAPRVDGTPTAYIGNDFRTSVKDTTDTRGTVSRRAVLRLPFVSDALRDGTIKDTIIVRATVRYLGADVPGSPVDYVIEVTKKP